MAWEPSHDLPETWPALVSTEVESLAQAWDENYTTLKDTEMLQTFNERLRREFPRITLPVFILHGTADKATMPAGSQLFFDTAGSTDKTLKLYDGHFHDLLNDVGKDGVLADIRAWIEARVGS